MFHKFANQGERRSYGGSGFLELQYCKMENGTSEKKIVSVNSIHHWQDDSLYVFADDIEQFLQDYIDIFADGLYNNMQHGKVDVYGINYYTSSQINEYIRKIESNKPFEYSVLLNWLSRAPEYNGINILGI